MHYSTQSGWWLWDVHVTFIWTASTYIHTCEVVSGVDHRVADMRDRDGA